MDLEVERELRKIRKKLRQIERLQEKAEDLTPDEFQKIQSQNGLRARVQTLLASSAGLSVATRSTAHTLQVGSSASAAAKTNAGAGDGTGALAAASADSSYSELDSSAVDLDSSAHFDDSGFMPSVSVLEEERAWRDESAAAHHDSSGRCTPPLPSIRLGSPSAPDPEPASSSSSSSSPPSSPPSKQSGQAAGPGKQQQRSATASGVSKSDKGATRTTAAAAPKLTQKERQKAERERFQDALRTGRMGWESSRLRVTTLSPSGGSGEEVGVTCVDCEGDLVVFGGSDISLRVWDVASATELHCLTGHTDTITRVTLLPRRTPLPEDSNGDAMVMEDRHAVTTSRDCTVRVWNLSRGKQCRSIYTYAPVLCMAWSSRVMATGADSGRVQLWSWPDFAEVCSIRVHEEAITCVQLHGRLLVTGDTPGTIKLWEVSQDLRSARPLPSMPSVRGSPLRPDLQQEERAACSTTGSYRPVQCLAVPSQQYLVWGDDGVNLKMFHMKMASVAKFPNHLGSFGRTDCVAPSSDGELLLSSAYDLDTGEGYINVRSTSTMQYLTTLHATDPGTLGFGHIRAVACTRTPAAAATACATASSGAGNGEQSSSQHRWCIAGDSLTVFDVVPPAKSAKKKPVGRAAALQENEFRFVFVPDLAGRAEDSDVESSDDDDDLSGDDNADKGHEADTEDDVEPSSGTTLVQRRRKKRGVQDSAALRQEMSPRWWFMRWCTIL